MGSGNDLPCQKVKIQRSSAADRLQFRTATKTALASAMCMQPGAVLGGLVLVPCNLPQNLTSLTAVASGLGSEIKAPAFSTRTEIDPGQKGIDV